MNNFDDLKTVGYIKQAMLFSFLRFRSVRFVTYFLLRKVCVCNSFSAIGEVSQSIFEHNRWKIWARSQWCFAGLCMPFYDILCVSMLIDLSFALCSRPHAHHHLSLCTFYNVVSDGLDSQRTRTAWRDAAGNSVLNFVSSSFYLS